MDRNDLQRLSKDELIEMVLAFAAPGQDGRAILEAAVHRSKEKRENSKPGGGKPGMKVTRAASAKIPTL